jgi:hypothetical protein
MILVYKRFLYLPKKIIILQTVWATCGEKVVANRLTNLSFTNFTIKQLRLRVVRTDCSDWLADQL